MPNVVALILAGGQGKRMHSNQSKSMHAVAGRPMIDWLLDACLQAGVSRAVVVVSPSAGDIRDHLNARTSPPSLVTQNIPQGTADAVKVALETLANLKAERVIILPGDLPNLRPQTLAPLISLDTGIACLTVIRQDPAAYGRIVRDSHGSIAKIVEFKDCTPQEAAIEEVNAGIYCASLEFLQRAIPQIGNDNAAGEYYLTDFIALAHGEGQTIRPIVVDDPGEVMGVNTPEELRRAEVWRTNQAGANAS